MVQVWLACALATMGVALVSLGGILPSGINVIEYIAGEKRVDPSKHWCPHGETPILLERLTVFSILTLIYK